MIEHCAKLAAAVPVFACLKQIAAESTPGVHLSHISTVSCRGRLGKASLVLETDMDVLHTPALYLQITPNGSFSPDSTCAGFDIYKVIQGMVPCQWEMHAVA